MHTKQLLFFFFYHQLSDDNNFDHVIFLYLNKEEVPLFLSFSKSDWQVQSQIINVSFYFVYYKEKAVYVRACGREWRKRIQSN